MPNLYHSYRAAQGVLWRGLISRDQVVLLASLRISSLLQRGIVHNSCLWHSLHLTISMKHHSLMCHFQNFLCAVKYSLQFWSALYLFRLPAYSVKASNKRIYLTTAQYVLLDVLYATRLLLSALRICNATLHWELQTVIGQRNVVAVIRSG